MIRRNTQKVIEINNPISALSKMVLWGFYEGYPDNTLLATIHAAAIGKSNGMIIMPGISGSGKTTLTAYLISKGWYYAGDDIIGISNNKNGFNKVLPFQSALSIKKGSIDILSQFYSNITDYPIVNYSGKKAYFVPAPKESFEIQGENSNVPIAIVFPKFKEKGPSKLTILTNTELIQNLVEVGIRTGEELEPEKLESLFNLFIDLPKYSLEYSSIEDAECYLEKML